MVQTRFKMLIFLACTLLVGQASSQSPPALSSPSLKPAVAPAPVPGPNPANNSIPVPAPGPAPSLEPSPPPPYQLPPGVSTADIAKLRETMIMLLNFTGGYVKECDSGLLLGENFLQAVVRCNTAQAPGSKNTTGCPPACLEGTTIIGANCETALNKAYVSMLASKNGRAFELTSFKLDNAVLCGGSNLNYDMLKAPYETGQTLFWLNTIGVSVPPCKADLNKPKTQTGPDTFSDLKGQCNVDAAATPDTCPGSCSQAIDLAGQACVESLAKATLAKNESLYTSEVKLLEPCGISAGAPSAPTPAPETNAPTPSRPVVVPPVSAPPPSSAGAVFESVVNVAVIAAAGVVASVLGA